MYVYMTNNNEVKFMLKSILYLFFSILIVASPYWANSQSTGVPISSPSVHYMDRLDVLYHHSGNLHSSIKPYWRNDLVDLADTFARTHGLTIETRYILKDNNEFTEVKNTIDEKNSKIYIDSSQTFFYSVESGLKEENYYFTNAKPFLKYFYKTPANFFEIDKQGFYLRFNPILHFEYGRDFEEETALFTNLRGIDLRAGIDDRVYLNLDILETQSRFPSYINEYINIHNAVPGAGFYKSYNSSIFDINNGYDYLNASGYAGVKVSRSINVEFGHGKNFIGNGMRSMLLSDFAGNYLYLKLNTRIWKFHYQNIFAEINQISNSDDQGDQLAPKKYFAAHYLGFKPNSKIEVGIFESVVFSRDQFELQYLNPVILYRTVEHLIGSKDNSMIGLNFKVNPIKAVSVYGQVMIDDLNIKLILDGNGDFWGNRWGIQTGVKYFDAFGIDFLDFQAEFNIIRPYTYAHRDSVQTNYSHFKQALAHPSGANLKEILVRCRYQPIENLVFTATLLKQNIGKDGLNENFGYNINKSTRTNSVSSILGITQGDLNKIWLFETKVSWQFMHNYFLDLGHLHRSFTSEQGDGIAVNAITGGLRVNFSNKPALF